MNVTEACDICRKDWYRGLSRGECQCRWPKVNGGNVSRVNFNRWDTGVLNFRDMLDIGIHLASALLGYSDIILTKLYF